MDEFYLALLLFIGAIGLAFVDIFIPSGGLLLVLAAVVAVASVLFGFRSSQTMGMTMLTLVTASIPVFAFVAIRIWPYTPIGRRVILRTADDDAEELPAALESVADPLLGQVVMAASGLMPSGQIKVGSRRVNAVAETGLIEAGTRVLVVDFRDRNYIVRATEQALTQPPLSNSPKRQSAATSPVNGLHADVPNDEVLLEQSMDELGLDSIDDDSLDDRLFNDDQDQGDPYKPPERGGGGSQG